MKLNLEEGANNVIMKQINPATIHEIYRNWHNGAFPEFNHKLIIIRP